MDYTRQYENRINFRNAPSTSTPLNATNLNKIDKALNYIDGKMEEIAEGGLLPDILSIDRGGTGNDAGYIQTGAAENSTVGVSATIEGENNVGSGRRAHAEGYNGTASGQNSHTEGNGNTASNSNAHAEGQNTQATGIDSHAEGHQTKAQGDYSHASGSYTTAGYANQTVVGKHNSNKTDTLFEVGNGTGSSAKSNAFEVYSNGNIKAQGTVSDANGVLNAVTANPSDTASTNLTKIKIGNDVYNIPSSASSLASLTDTIINSPSNGQTLVFNSVSGKWENQNGANSLDGLTDTFIYSPLDGQLLVYDATHGDWRNLYADYNKLQNHPQINLAELTGNKSFSDLGLKANPSDTASTALSKIKIDGTTYSVNGMPADPLPKANGGTGNADGYIRTGWDGDSGIGTHATIEGYSNKAVSDGCHAEGIETAARGTASHAEGYHTNIAANTNYAHAEGYSTTVNGQGGHAEGYGTTATGRYSHAEGYSNTATGNYSHVGGRNNTAGYANQTVIGKYNSNKSDTLFEVGNGESGSPNNALELYDTGLLKVGAVETASGLLRTVTANPSDTASTALTKLKVGSQTYSIPNGGSSSYSDLTDKPQINSVTLSGNKSLSDIGIEANPSSSGSTDLTKLKVGSTTYNIPSGGGSGNTKLKTRYSISYSSWSSSPNSDGYYTYSLTLSPTLDTTVSPDVLIAGSSNTSQPTDTHKTMFGYVERCYLSGSSLTLYAKTKPTSYFYIWVEGVAGSGSGSIVGNIIQPNGAVSGGGETYSSTETVIGTWMGKTLYRKVVDCGYSPSASETFPYAVKTNAGLLNISNLQIVKIYGFMDNTYTGSPDYCYPLPLVQYNTDPSLIIQLSLYYNYYDGMIYILFNRHLWNSGYEFKIQVVIEYTKS